MFNIRVAVVAAALCSSVGTRLPAGTGSTQPPGSWGVNVQTLYHGPALQKIGTQWVRLGIRWEQVERTGPGRYDWAATDKMLNYYLDNGFHIVCSLTVEKSNPVYASSAQDKDAISGAIARWMGATAQRYKGKGIVWEIGNEPEAFTMGGFWNHPDVYASMAKSAATAIKQGDPAAKVAALAMAWMDRDFATRALRAGLLQQGNIDYLSFHGYHRWTIQPESGLEEDIGWLRAQGAAAMAAGKPAPEVIDTECGYSIVPFEASKSKDSWRVSVYTEETQAAYLARHFIEEIYLRVPISIWYKDMNGENQFSLYYGDENSPKGLRPSGRMFASLAQLLPDSPEALRNDRFAVTIKPSSPKAAGTELRSRSFLRSSASGQTLIIAAWNAVEASDGKILAARTITNSQVTETWRDATSSDSVSVASRISIDGLAGISIQSTRVLTFPHGTSIQQNAKLDTVTNPKSASIDVPVTPMPTIVTITFAGGPGPPSDLRISPKN